MSAVLSLMVRLVSVVAGFGIAFFIGHRIGAEGNGYYAIITQTALLLSTVATGGFDLAIVREYAAAIAGAQKVDRGDVLRILGILVMISVALCLALLPAWEHVTTAFFDRSLGLGALAALSILFLTRTVTRVSAAFLRTQQLYVFSQGIEVALVPSLVLLLVLILVPRSVDTIVLWTAGASIFTAALGVAANLVLSSRAPGAIRRPFRRLLRTALPLSGVALTLNFLDWYSLSSVALMLGVADAGIYRIAMQIGSMLSIINSGLYSVFSAKIGAAFSTGDRREVGRLCRSAMRLALLLTIPLAVVLFVGAEPILRLIDPEFVSGAAIVRVVAVGQVVVAVFGISGVALTMSGHAHLNLVITMSGLATAVVLAPLGAWAFGAIGVTLCLTAIAILMSAANTAALRRVSGVNAITGAVAS